MKRYFLILALPLLLLDVSPVKAQTFEFGLFAGTSTYIGDYNPYNEPSSLITKPGISGGVFARFNYTDHVALRLNAIYGQISGTADNTTYFIPPAQQTFSTGVAELSLIGEINFLPYVAGDPDSKFSPYIFGGSGAVFFEDVYAQEYKINRLGLILGLGFKYHITNKINGGVEWGMRATTTDELDGIYHTANSPGVGNPKVNDWYSFAGLTFTIRIRDRCSVFCPY